MAKRQLYIGSDFGGLNFYEEDGSAMTAAPYVTLHDRLRNKYYVADIVIPNADGKSYDAVFSSGITTNMSEGPHHLVVFADSTMKAVRYREQDFCIAMTVPPSPGQINDSGSES